MSKEIKYTKDREEKVIEINYLKTINLKKHLSQ